MDEIQILVVRVREVGLLPPRRVLRTLESSRKERRAGTDIPPPARLSLADVRSIWANRVGTLSALRAEVDKYKG